MGADLNGVQTAVGLTLARFAQEVTSHLMALLGVQAQPLLV